MSKVSSWVNKFNTVASNIYNSPITYGMVGPASIVGTAAAHLFESSVPPSYRSFISLATIVSTTISLLCYEQLGRIYAEQRDRAVTEKEDLMLKHFEERQKLLTALVNSIEIPQNNHETAQQIKSNIIEQIQKPFPN